MKTGALYSQLLETHRQFISSRRRGGAVARPKSERVARAVERAKEFIRGYPKTKEIIL